MVLSCSGRRFYITDPAAPPIQYEALYFSPFGHTHEHRRIPFSHFWVASLMFHGESPDFTKLNRHLLVESVLISHNLFPQQSPEFDSSPLDTVCDFLAEREHLSIKTRCVQK